MRETYLLAAGKEEVVGIDAISDRAANDRKPVKDHRWFIQISEENLFQNIDDNRESNKRTQA